MIKNIVILIFIPLTLCGQVNEEFPVDDFSSNIELESKGLIGLSLDNDTIVIGEKIILLSFGYFACRPCMLEIPYLNKLMEIYGDKVDVVAIFPHVASDLRKYQENIDTASVYCRIRRHAGFEKINYKIIPECSEKRNKSKDSIAPECNTIRKKFGIESFPTNLLIDKNGVVREIYTGFAAYELENIVDKIINDIDSLLDEELK